MSVAEDVKIFIQNREVIQVKVGCVKEIKNNEFRVGMTPDNVKAYVGAGHEVYIEKEMCIRDRLYSGRREKFYDHCLSGTGDWR